MEAEVVKRLSYRARKLQQSGARTKSRARWGYRKKKGRKKREEGEGVRAVESINGEEGEGGQATTTQAEESKV